MLAILLVTIQNAILSVVSFLLFSLKVQPNPKRILILRTAALGDFIFSIPAMAALRRQYPDALIQLITTSATSKIVSGQVDQYAGDHGDYPWLSLVIPSLINKAIVFRSTNPKILMREFAPIIKQYSPDAVIILPHPGEGMSGLLKKILFFKLLGVKYRVLGFKMRYSISYLKKNQFEVGLFEHKVMGPLRAITEIPEMPNVNQMPIEFPIVFGEEASQWAVNLWRQNTLDNKRVIVIAPGSIQSHKRWPEDKFITLLDRLSDYPNLYFVIIGTKSDYEIGETILKKAQVIGLNIAGKSTILESAALLNKATLLVGNDGGAMHLGAAVKCPTVSIVPGIEYPGSIEPWGYQDLAVRHPVECAPCYSFISCPKGHNKCMNDLTVEKVVEKCQFVLRGLK